MDSQKQPVKFNYQEGKMPEASGYRDEKQEPRVKIDGTRRLLDTLADILADVSNTLERIQDGQEAIHMQLQAIGERVGELNPNTQVRIEVPDDLPVLLDTDKESSIGLDYRAARELLDAEPPYRSMGHVNQMTEYEKVMNHPMFTRPKLWAAYKEARHELLRLKQAMPELTQREIAALITGSSVWKRLCPTETLATQQLSGIEGLYVIYKARTGGRPGFRAGGNLSPRRLSAISQAIRDLLKRMDANGERESN